MSRPPHRDGPDRPHAPSAAPEPDPVDAAARAPARLAVLRATGLLDTPPEPAFDRLTRLAARLLDVPAAFLSLVDEERDFYKAACGLPEPLATEREVQGRTFCHHCIAEGTPERPLVIDDTAAHPVYGRVPTVRTLGVAAYVGVPLVVDGEAIGSLCAIDLRPRAWTVAEVEVLRELAASAQREIELRVALERARRTTDELQQAYHEREELLGASTDGIYAIDHRGRILFANRAAAELLGYAPDEMIGREAHALFHHSYADGTPYPRERCAISLAADQGRAVRVTDEVLWRRDGTSFPVDYASSPVVREGRVVGAVVRFTDITEQRRAVEGLRLLAESGRALSASLEVEETLRAVARLAMPQLAEMVMVDLVEEDGRIRRVAASHVDDHASELFERASRYPPRLGDGGPQARVIESGESLLVREIDDAWIGALNRADEHTEIVRELAPRSLLVAPLRARGQVLGAVAFVRGAGRAPFDEGDRELAEELARRAALAVENARLYDAARRATRARDDMLGVVSHDLRNPIHSVFMSASFLLDLLPESMRVERTQAAVSRRAAERANRLIQDLLDITQIESGRLALDRAPYRAASLAHEALELAEGAAAAGKVALERGEMDREATVWADRDRVLQALGNLIGNALKFTPEGGRVTVSVRGDGQATRVSVADTGPGIPAAQLPHLFDRYWQANRKDRRGVGLGLSIVKGIAEAHCGDVEVETAEGAGTTFTLVFPATEEAASRAPLAGAAPGCADG